MRQVGTIADPGCRRDVKSLRRLVEPGPVSGPQVAEVLPRRVLIVQLIARVLEADARLEELLPLNTRHRLAFVAEVVAHVGDEMHADLEHESRVPDRSAVDG